MSAGPDMHMYPAPAIERPDGSRIGRLVRNWFPTTLFILMTANVAVRATGPVTDPDPWWHLRLGSEFLGEWSLAHPGQLSPFATQPWVATQWTLEVIASVVEQWCGLAGIAAMTGLAAVVLAAVFWTASRDCAQPLPAALAAAAAFLAATQVIAPRPQIASLVLIGIATIAWRRTTADLKARWWLVPVSWLWACTHGFWFLGVFLGLAVVSGLLLDGRVSVKGALRLGAIPVLSLVAAVLTPAGPRLLLAPFMVNNVADHIQEWQPPNFHEPTVLVVGVMGAIVVLTAARGGATPFVDLLVLIFATMMLVYAARTVAVAAVLLVPLTATSIQTWLGSAEVDHPRRGERVLVRVGLVIGAVGVVITAVVNSPYRDPYPPAIDDALAALPEDAVVFNEYAYGGWMAWRYPGLTHGIDGMTEAYPPEYVSEYLGAEELAPGWESFLNRIGATHAFLPRDGAMAGELERHLHWTVLARTNRYVVLHRPSG